MDERTLCVRMLGEFSFAWAESEPVAIRSPRLQNLLAFLLLHRTAPQSRQRIASLLWPDSTDSQARTNLRYLLHQFRHEVPGGENWIEADTSHIWWHQAFPFALDLAQFEELIALANQPQKGQDTVTYLEQAVRLYRGDLLPALYEDWVSEHREHLRTALRAAIERLIRALANSGRYREGATYAEARHPRLPA